MYTLPCKMICKPLIATQSDGANPAKMFSDHFECVPLARLCTRRGTCRDFGPAILPRTRQPEPGEKTLIEKIIGKLLCELKTFELYNLETSLITTKKNN